MKNLEEQKPKSPLPRIKYNNGRGAILCNWCAIMIKSNLTFDETQGKTDILFCSEQCKQEYADNTRTKETRVSESESK